MVEKCISSMHIEKLGHEILEIRERALFNLNSKLDHGFTFDNALARSKEILLKLFEWFLFEPCTKQNLVFSLIKRILQSPSGSTLINHHGAAPFKQELKQIRTYIEPKYYPQLDEILQILDQFQVPPLETDLPLSYRSESQLNTERTVGSTATTIAGFIQQDASANQQNCLQFVETPSTPMSSPKTYTIYPLKWQVLIEADRHVLQSIENSLKKPPQASALLHSSDFFKNVLLHDFPAEIFLQRPTIVFTFYDLITNCPSTRVTNSVLNCFIHLTQALQIRVNHHNDPSTNNCKDNINCSEIYSNYSSPDSRKTASGQSEDDATTRPEFSILINRSKQMTFTQYCFSTFKCIFKYLCVKPETIKLKKPNQRGTNLALLLLDELLKLLDLILDKDVWNEESSPLIDEIRKELNEVLIGFGVSLEYYRIEANSDDFNVNNMRVVQIHFLHNCANFLTIMVPLSQTGLILPRNLKNALANSLVDVALAKLYPDVHQTILNYVESFRIGGDSEALIKYKETNRICSSMTAAVDFMRNSQNYNANDGINIAKEALPSLEFHKNLTFIKQVIELCSTKVPFYPCNDEIIENYEYVILKLLGHNCEDIREETYRLCQRRVIAAIGPKLNDFGSGVPGSQIVFLLRGKILIEMACHGLTNENFQIRNFAEDILIHIIKCKILVSEEIWNKIVEALIIALPILLCHASKSCSLGRNLLNIIDPDTAESLNLSEIDVIKGNILLFFVGEVAVREEAFSRLCWLLASQQDSREMLPRLNNLHDKALPNICQIQRVFDVNKTRHHQHFYQPSSLQQVLELLKASNVEPVIRRSALTQASVMMEDPLLHSVFLHNGGLKLILQLMKSALIEKNFHDYPDSVIPALSILKNLCLYQTTARQSLYGNIEVYFIVMRSIFMFFAEEKLRHDAVCVLFLLIFHNFVKGSPSKADFSIPLLLNQKLVVPFSCNFHWEISQHYEASLVEFLSADKWCLSSLQLQWNSEISGGFDKLLAWQSIDEANSDIVDLLKLKNYDLDCLKASSIDYYLGKYLKDVQNGVTHENVTDSINKLTTYVNLCYVSGGNRENVHKFPWESTFSRFLKLLPSSEDDAKLLSTILNFLKFLAPFYKNSDNPFWPIKMLKTGSNCLLDLITVEPSSNDDFKVLSQDLLSLITICASQEQHYLDFYNFSNCNKLLNNETISWRSIIEIIAKNLKFSENIHFYNLSYLDALLNCLVHLTATLNWSNALTNARKIHSLLVNSLCELVVVFHCGKGPTAAISVMGLSITRNVILILNHIVAEMHFTKLKNWEYCFIEVEVNDWLKSFLVLWSSRDVILRAGILQLFAGLAASPKMAINIINELKNEKQGIWHMVLDLLVDHSEASIVRENCAFLLVNLTGHATNHINLFPNVNSNIFNLFEDYVVGKNLIQILEGLYSVNLEGGVITPSFIKSITYLLVTLLNFNSKQLAMKLQEFGLVKLLFRCICIPTMSIDNTKKLSLYCDILEMNTSICLLLSELVGVNQACLGTVLHTRDCLNVMVSLLNPTLYHSKWPQLIYLRNKLWSEIFKLISALLGFDCELLKNGHCNEELQIITQTIEEVGSIAFLETLCAAIQSSEFNELQNAALTSLTCLLRIEIEEMDKSIIRKILDTIHIGNHAAGAEICNILLHLHNLSNVKTSKDSIKKKSSIHSCLMSILSLSDEAKKWAFLNHFHVSLVKQLKDFHARLSLESAECLKRISDKKRLCPLLKELNELIGLITNFMIGNERIKSKFAEMGLSDFIHKLWVWFCVDKSYLCDVLRMLCTFTNQCPQACQSLPLTSSVAGSGPRKIPSKISLIHALINLIEKEMDLVSKTHTLNILHFSMMILKNCCTVIECRIIFCKSSLLHCISRLHPAITKRQKPWELVELMWLEFLQIFSLHPEGQSSIAKINDVFELIITLTSNSKSLNTKSSALLVLRNIAFYQPNRARLLNSDDFLNVLKMKLDHGNNEEKGIVVVIMWALASNNQKAKIIFKAAQFDVRLQQILTHFQLAECASNDEMERIKYVLSILRDDSR